MKFGSVCSGIEAASVAFEPLGWKAAWFSEIEPFPCAVLKHHYPNTPNYGDMTTLPEKIRSGEVEAPDLFCGGTPCQAFSVAGLRQSLADDRGNLSLTFCEIANAIDDVRCARGESASIVFWENVPGVLSTKDNAFGCFLGALAGCDTPIVPGGIGWTDSGVVAGPQRTVSWRILDAQYFGLAQRRRRVFVVASARDGFDPAAVLLEFNGVRRDFAPSREERQGAAGTITARTEISRNNHEECVTMTLQARMGSGGADHETKTLIPASAGREFGPSGGKFVDVNPTLNARAKDGPIRNQLAGAVLQSITQFGDIAGSLTARFDSSPCADRGQNIVLSSAYAVRTANTSANGHGIAEEVSHTLDQAQGQAVAYKTQCKHCIKFFSQYQCSAPTHGECDCPKCQGYCKCHQEEQPAICIKGAAIGRKPEAGPQYGETLEEMAYTQNCVDVHGVLTPAMQVRRLTPVECERLQGFPDNYTNIPWRNKPESPDGPRYKALGNSWAVPCVQWIGRRIQQEAQGKTPS